MKRSMMNHFGGLLAVIVVAGACTAAAGQLAPHTEPLNELLIPTLFKQIDRGEKVDFELLCLALVGDQMTLRAYAATLLGDSGDRRAIPFLIDALSDPSMHAGALYLDAGDATTRHRANKS